MANYSRRWRCSISSMMNAFNRPHISFCIQMIFVSIDLSFIFLACDRTWIAHGFAEFELMPTIQMLLSGTQSVLFSCASAKTVRCNICSVRPWWQCKSKLYETKIARKLKKTWWPTNFRAHDDVRLAFVVCCCSHPSTVAIIIIKDAHNAKYLRDYAQRAKCTDKNHRKNHNSRCELCPRTPYISPLCARCARIDQSVIIMYYLRYSEHRSSHRPNHGASATAHTNLFGYARSAHGQQSSIHPCCCRSTTVFHVLHRTSHRWMDALSYGKQNERCSFFFASLRFTRSTTSICRVHIVAQFRLQIQHTATLARSRTEWREREEKNNEKRFRDWKRKHKPEKNNVERNSDLRKVNNNKIVIVDNTCSPQLGCFVYILRLFAFAWSLRFTRDRLFWVVLWKMYARGKYISRTGQFETLEPYFFCFF